jgi:hypothetical protein
MRGLEPVTKRENWVIAIYVGGKFRLEFSNREFAALWNSLGLRLAWSGEIDGRLIETQIDSLDRGVVREFTGRYVASSVLLENALGKKKDTAIANLRAVCREAILAEENVTWK